METTVQWLKRYCPTKLDPERIAELLTMSGTEVEESAAHSRTGDTALKLEITSNRTDCYGVLGLARELSALTGEAFEPPALDYETLSTPAADVSGVTLECPDLCPVYTLQVIRGVQVGPSPQWLLDLFEALAEVKNIRPVNNVVDITNFVMLEMAQPLHAFDAAKMAERRIVVRRAQPGESFVAIDGSRYEFVPPEKRNGTSPEGGGEYVWDPDICVIADAQRPQCLGGVMGGLDSEITEVTTDVLLESAYFEPLNNRATSRMLNLHSDSSYRFSRGVDPAGVVAASRRAARLIAEICGGEVYEGVIQAGDVTAEPWTVPFRHAALKRTLGIDVEPERAVEYLTRLGLELPKDAVKLAKKEPQKPVEVTVPTYRRDLTREIDLVEEVGRLVGYGEVPTDTGMRATATGRRKRERVFDLVRERLVAAGYHETISDSFVPVTDVYRHSPWKAGGHVSVVNPVVTGQGLLRPSMLASLLGLRRFNQNHGQLSGVRLFELGRVFAQHAAGSKPTSPAQETTVLALTTDGAEAWRDAKGVVDSLCEALQVAVRYEPVEFAHFAPGLAAQALLEVDGGTQRLAVIGEASEEVRNSFDLQTPCALAELHLDRLAEAAELHRTYRDLPRYPGITRELALIIPEAVTWQELSRTIRDHGGAWLRTLTYLDEYRGKQIPKGKKQYTLEMFFQSPERSLTSDEVNQQLDTLLQQVRQANGAELRT